MKTIVTNQRSLVNSNNLVSNTFGIKSQNLQHIISLLRDDIYKDKILAVIREYSTNAFDANIAAGKRDIPIVVSLPNKLSPEFKVRDYGMGLSEQDVREIYTSYGESTKRNTNDAVGYLGIGCKSGFAYGDNFVVTSFHNGIKTVYNAALDASGVGSMVTLYSENTDEQSGVEITIPVKSGDETLFINKSIEFFKYWNIRPQILGSDREFINQKYGEDKPIVSGDDWKVYGNEGYRENSYAVMGNISYPIEWRLIREKIDSTTNKKLCNNFDFFQYNRFILNFNIGELQFSPSRESLQYTEYTISSIVSKLEKTVDAVGEQIVKDITSQNTLWDAKVKYNSIFKEHYRCGTGGLNYINGFKTILNDRLVFNGVKLSEDVYENAGSWDANIGDTSDLLKEQKEFADFEPVLRIAYNRSRRNKVDINLSGLHYPSRIEISNKTIFVEMDKVVKTNLKRSLKWYFDTQSIDKANLLVFNNNDVRQSFLTKFNFAGAKYTKFSEIYQEFKKTLPKKVRKNAGDNSLTSNEVKARTINLSKDYRHGYNDTHIRRYGHFEPFVDVDLQTESGFYIKVNSNNCVVINGSCIEGYKFNECLALMNRIGKKYFDLENYKCVYVFGEKILSENKFNRNKKNWTDVATILLPMMINFINSIPNIVEKVAFSTVEHDMHSLMSDISLLKRLCSNITNPNNKIVEFSKFYLIDTISDRTVLSNITYIAKCLTEEFNIETPIFSKKLIEASKKNMEKLMKDINSKYPMLDMIHDSLYRLHERKNGMQTIADYINMVDSVSV